MFNKNSLSTWVYKKVIRPVFFLFDSEKVHRFVFWICRRIQNSSLLLSHFQKKQIAFSKRIPNQTKFSLGHLDLKNPIGLAAGFDKNAEILPFLETLGFGFLETGTVTPLPQPGNVKPRLARIADKSALLNRMGFNNDGADEILARLKWAKTKVKIPIGINIGKNKDTPDALAKEDYRILLEKFASTADYFVINVSSPNTPGLRGLQNKAFLESLGELILKLQIHVDVFLKLSPDLDFDVLKEICSLCKEGKPFSGLVLTNTIPTDLGGISGKPLAGPSLATLKAARTILDRNIPIISVGGVFAAEDVKERLREGASAVQVYTALVYEGPDLVRKLF